jgi:hypothetical protein
MNYYMPYIENYYLLLNRATFLGSAFITSIKNDYPGLTDYYTRYEYNVAPTTTHKYATRVDGTTF